MQSRDLSTVWFMDVQKLNKISNLTFINNKSFAIVQ
jgi:hypothetical protein